MPVRGSAESYQFGEFTLDAGAYELRRQGCVLRLQRQPLDLLLVLVRRRGQLVSREEIAELLWGQDAFVEVEVGIHTAIRKIRRALGDEADAPRYVETVAGRGYRFMGLVETALLVGILPFANLSDRPDLDHLGDGLAEETTASLGQIDPDHLRVVGRTTMLRYRGSDRTPGEIGRELGADYLLESSLRGEGTRLRVTARLLRTTDEVQVWAASFDHDGAAGLLGVQQEISTALAEQILRQLSPERVRVVARRQTQNTDAYDLYLRGLWCTRRRTPEGNRQAVELLMRATALDPAYSLGWAALSLVQTASLLTGDSEPAVVGPRVRHAAERAMATNPTLAEAQFVHGYYLWLLKWDWSGAEREMRQSVTLDSQYADATRTLGHALSQMARHEEAEAFMCRTRATEPLDPMAYGISAQVAFQARDFDHAARLAERAIALEPTFWIGHFQLAQAEAARGHLDQALDAVAEAERLSGRNSKAVALRGHVLATLGRAGAARALLDALADASAHRYVPPYATALIHMGLGDVDAALAHLDRAYAVRDVHLMYLPVDHKWDRVRRDPRFSGLVERCGFVPTQRVAQA